MRPAHPVAEPADDQRLGSKPAFGPKSTSPIFVVLGAGPGVRPRADDQPLIAARVLGAGALARSPEKLASVPFSRLSYQPVR